MARHAGSVPRSPVIERLVARAPVLLVILPLALLAWVSIHEQDDPARLLAGAPAAVVLVAYLRSGRRR